MKHLCVISGLVLALVQTTHAVIVCHDYAMLRATNGTDPRPLTSPATQGTGVAELRSYLTSNGYKRFPYANAAEDPERAGRILKPGDVLILRDDHSGFVNDKGLIDHFIQVFGASGSKYDAGSLPKHASLGEKVGGLYENETLRDFLSRPFYKGPDKRLEVWRRAPR